MRQYIKKEERIKMLVEAGMEIIKNNYNSDWQNFGKIAIAAETQLFPNHVELEYEDYEVEDLEPEEIEAFEFERWCLTVELPNEVKAWAREVNKYERVTKMGIVDMADETKINYKKIYGR